MNGLGSGPAPGPRARQLWGRRSYNTDENKCEDSPRFGLAMALAVVVLLGEFFRVEYN